MHEFIFFFKFKFLKHYVDAFLVRLYSSRTSACISPATLLQNSILKHQWIEEHSLLECDFVYTGRGTLTFRGIVLPPSPESMSNSSRSHVNGKEKALLLVLVACLSYPSTLKMEAVCCSETCVDFSLTKFHIPEDLYGHSRKNLKFKIN
jgi:hypothetical protein